jgi:hypothetical protein
MTLNWLPLQELIFFVGIFALVWIAVATLGG